AIRPPPDHGRGAERPAEARRRRDVRGRRRRRLDGRGLARLHAAHGDLRAQRQLRRHGRRGRRAAGDRLRPRARRPLAELAAQHPPLPGDPPHDRDGPPRLRGLGDAGREDLDHRLRKPGRRAVRPARRGVRDGGRQLDGRLHRGGAGTLLRHARREARARLGRRAVDRVPAPR
ncbi:MAG: hypothetical protein AVDCRST_MAG30-2447, partial [uncultured Solirubrobacteraceae bacterium]